MSNLIITNNCQNNCNYCFLGPKGEQNLNVNDVKLHLPFLKSFPGGRINILGGEPTLNPDFLKIINLLMDEGFKVKIYTNGSWPQGVVKDLQKMQGEYSLLVNRTNPVLNEDTVHLYQALDLKIQLGFVFYHLAQSLEHIQKEILRYGLNKVFHLGIAMPIWPDKLNTYLLPTQYKLASATLYSYIKDFLAAGIRPEFQCGFPICFFNEKQKKFFQQNGINFTSKCDIVPDIGPGATITPCQPLVGFSERLTTSTRRSQIIKKLQTKIAYQPLSPLLPSCQICSESIKKNCSGGCIALRITNADKDEIQYVKT